ncbi:MAG: hypothetical protein A1D16_18310 [Flavihumibacter sp. CACIAM 22H1]|nr:MAG: hypothetical protein A1D16_18310 [Flavihumibacter sp. CACIAM 22H1]
MLNWNNLQFDPFTKLYLKILQKIKKEKLEIIIKDPFYRTVDSSTIIPNKFGSFSGSFKIPETAATGSYSFDTYPLETNFVQNEFQVEEYKRPSYEIRIDHPKLPYGIGDTIPVKIKLHSFSGAVLNNIPVQVSIEAYGPNMKFPLLKIDTTTNGTGEFIVLLTDPAGKELGDAKNGEYKMEYVVKAKALSPTGEEQEKNYNIQLNKHPILLSHSIPLTLDLATPIQFRLTAQSNYEALPGRLVQYKICRLNGDELLLITDKTDTTNKWIPLETQVIDTGIYQIELFYYKENQLNGYKKSTFKVYNSSKRLFPYTQEDFVETHLHTGRETTIQWIEGFREDSNYCIFHIRYKNKKDKYFDKYHFIYQNKGLQNIELPIPVDATGAFTITRIYLKNNQLHRTEKRYHLPESSKSLEIIVEKFRTTLTPGAKEEFVVSVISANKKAVAELMTTMYDASLDKLQEHSWQLPEEGRGRYVTSKWFTQINEYSNSSLESTQPAVVTRRSKLWWRPNEYLYPILYDYVILNSVQEDVSRTLSGRVAGIQVLNTPGLEEVIVVGYGVSKALNSTSAIQIRGSISWNAYANSLIIIDGVPYTEDLSKIDFSTIKNGVILKSAEATALYGSRAANGVVLLSTTGVVQLPSAPPPPVLIRKSFNETAFFHPQLSANKKGLYQIRFTLPQTATEWKWKVLAHTPDARFQYLEKSIFSKLPLMVLPDLPRFVYQGDSIEISTRVANLDTTSMTVLLTCELLDELTGENITHLFLKDSLQTITVGTEQTNYGTFKVSIPDQFLHPVRIKFIGRSATYSDGEEHLLPILSKKQLIRQSVELNEMNSSAPIYPPVLPSDAIPFGIGLSIAEQPQAALINSLPGLANYSFNCAEQTTNKMLAHLVAVHLVKKELLTATETTTNQSISNEKAGNLPAGTRSAAMPWLELTEKQQLLQKQLKLLTDTAQSIEKAGEYLKEIIDMQLKNGALPWFKSGDPDLFISNYVLGSFGKMQKDGYLLPLKKKELEDINQFLQNLIRFCDNAINTNPSNFNEIDYLYARSFHHNRYPLADSAVAKLLAMYHFHWKKVASYSYSRQAKLITATLNYFKTSDSCYQEALALLEFIRQAGITDPAKGIRWKIISNYDELNSTQEELLADLQEAFNSSEKYPTVSQGILQWILQDRNSHEWRSTKGAASMIYQLATTPYNDRDNQTEKTIVYDQQKLSVSNGIATGSSTTFLSVQEKSFKGLLQEHTQGKPQPAQVHYYYFSANTAVNESNNTIQLNKHLERWDAQKNTWVNVDSSTICIVGDRIRIKIQLTTKKPLQYLVLNERHPATMEPVEVLSGMRYSNDFFYYCSVRDIGHHFFISSLPTGTSEIMYEMKLTKPGNFNSGIYSIQAMYQPAIQTSGPSYKLIVNSSQSKADQ